MPALQAIPGLTPGAWRAGKAAVCARSKIMQGIARLTSEVAKFDPDSANKMLVVHTSGT
jgi:hypothetical protein